LAEVVAVLPIELAQELVDDRAATPLQGSRDIGVVGVLVEVVNSAADVVTVAIGASALPAVLRRARDWVGRRNGTVSSDAELRIKVSGKEFTVMSRGDEEAVLDLLHALGRAGPDSDVDDD
jgi:hypothetical protein